MNQDDEKYWFTKDKIDTIASMYTIILDNLPQIGKVLILFFYHRCCNSIE